MRGRPGHRDGSMASRWVVRCPSTGVRRPSSVDTCLSSRLSIPPHRTSEPRLTQVWDPPSTLFNGPLPKIPAASSGTWTTLVGRRAQWRVRIRPPRRDRVPPSQNLAMRGEVVTIAQRRTSTVVTRVNAGGNSRHVTPQEATDTWSPWRTWLAGLSSARSLSLHGPWAAASGATRSDRPQSPRRAPPCRSASGGFDRSVHEHAQVGGRRSCDVGTSVWRTR